MAKWGTKEQPKKKGRYLVTFKDGFGNYVGIADRYLTHYGEWSWSVAAGGNSSDIIAWQKLQEPYKGE